MPETGMGANSLSSSSSEPLSTATSSGTRRPACRQAWMTSRPPFQVKSASGRGSAASHAPSSSIFRFQCGDWNSVCAFTERTAQAKPRPARMRTKASRCLATYSSPRRLR